MNPSTGKGLGGCRLEALEYAVPDRPWQGMRGQRRWQVDGLPPLQSLTLELNVFRALLRNPARHLHLSRHHTLTKNRWLAGERVAKAALRDGHSTDAIAHLLSETLAEFAPPDFEYTAGCAASVVQTVLNAPRTWVVHPGNSKCPRIVGRLT